MTKNEDLKAISIRDMMGIAGEFRIIGNAETSSSYIKYLLEAWKKEGIIFMEKSNGE